MSEIGEIHDKINATNKTLARMEGSMEATFPHLATEASLVKAIAEHRQECPGSKKISIMPPRNSVDAKLWGKAIGAIVALAGLVVLLAKALM